MKSGPTICHAYTDDSLSESAKSKAATFTRSTQWTAKKIPGAFSDNSWIQSKWTSQFAKEQSSTKYRALFG